MECPGIYVRGNLSPIGRAGSQVIRSERRYFPQTKAEYIPLNFVPEREGTEDATVIPRTFVSDIIVFKNADLGIYYVNCVGKLKNISSRHAAQNI